MAVIVVGIDPSLTSTGLASVDWNGAWYAHRVRSKGHRDDSLSLRSGRLRRMRDEILSWVAEADTDLVVIESPSYGSKHGSPHDRSGLWWMVVSELQSKGYPIATVTPNGRAMYGTGKGTSDKATVEAAVRARYTDVSWPSGKCDDIADAVLLASMGARYLGQPVEPDGLPESHTRALAGAAWPEVIAA